MGCLGLIGSFAPTIVNMYNNLPNIAFVLKWEWGIVILLYGFLGGLMAAIYPYRDKPSAWQALLIGCGFPAIVGSAASILKLAQVGTSLGTSSAEASRSLLDILAMF